LAANTPKLRLTRPRPARHIGKGRILASRALFGQHVTYRRLAL